LNGFVGGQVRVKGGGRGVPSGLVKKEATFGPRWAREKGGSVRPPRPPRPYQGTCHAREPPEALPGGSSRRDEFVF